MAFGRPSAKDERRELQTREWLQKQNAFAVASVVLGVFSLIELGIIPLFSIAAIVLGVVGRRQLKQPVGPRTQGRGLAVAGIILGAISLAIGGTLYTLHWWR